MAALDLTRQRYGRLIVMERVPGRVRTTWKCQCDCGNIVDVTTHELRANKRPTRSCGCLKEDVIYKRCWRGCGSLGLDLWNRYRRGAASRGISFSIGIEDAWAIFEQQTGKCALTGVEIVFPINGSKSNRSTCTASLDRIDATRGYEMGNIQWVHKTVNIMKNVLSEGEFIEWCRLVAKHAESKHRYDMALSS